MGTGMAVTAHDGLPGLSRTQFGADDMHDAAMRTVHREHLEAEFAAVVLHRGHLLRGACAGRLEIGKRAKRGSWRRVIQCAQRQVRPRSEEHTSELQSRENLVCRLLLEKK